MELKADATKPISSVVLTVARAFKSPCEIESATFANETSGFVSDLAISAVAIDMIIDMMSTKLIFVRICFWTSARKIDVGRL